jgi:Amt family ammonium transporter
MAGELWVVICGMAALLMRLGFALHQAGMVRSKNSAGAILRGIADLCLAVLAFSALGAAILLPASSGAGRLLNAKLLLHMPPAGQADDVFRYLCATLIATGIVCGVAGERSRFFPMLCSPVLLAGLVAPVIGRWIFAGGWLAHLGFHDAAAASMIHLAGGLCAAAAAVCIGPRMGKYNRDGSSNGIPGHSVPLASIGVFVMFIAWLPYVLSFSSGRYALANVAMNVLLAGAAGGLASLLLCQIRYGKPDIHLTYAGLLGALVAISAGADAASSFGAVCIGAVAGIIVPLLTLTLDLAFRIDDPTGGIAVHAGGAVWGILAAGLVAPTASFGDRLRQIGVQVLGLVVISAWALLTSWALFATLNKTVGLRSKEADEFDGLDLAEHDIGAYPDFQQTTIKSYHLREA